MSKRYDWEVTSWTKGGAECDAIVQGYLDSFNGLFAVTTNRFEKNLRTKQTDLSCRNVVPQKFYVDLVPSLILYLPTDDPFSSYAIGGRQIAYFHLAAAVINKI